MLCFGTLEVLLTRRLDFFRQDNKVSVLHKESCILFMSKLAPPPRPDFLVCCFLYRNLSIIYLGEDLKSSAVACQMGRSDWLHDLGGLEPSALLVKSELRTVHS